MLFHTLDFAVFLPIVFSIYWFVFQRNLKAQNFLIVLASYFFYGWWDWRFLLLILLSTLVDFGVGLQLRKTKKQNQRIALLWLSILVNIGLLGFFKYFNFFVENFFQAFSFFNYPISPYTLDIILPVGISFYTFQTLSYTIDIYRHKLEPTRDFISFAAFVSFFPQLVAGPIERAANLLPQFHQSRVFSYDQATEGLRQLAWGLFKKMVIADNFGAFVNVIFAQSEDFSGSNLALGAIFFSFQIYADFSGYSDIALGTARLFGFQLSQNFAYPYFSRNIGEFWRRWHISLSTWFRDYLYIPLGGSRGNSGLQIRNIFLIFLLSGLWHGANWTFIFWGALHAFMFIPFLLTQINRKYLDTVAFGKKLPNLRELFSMVLTFSGVTLAWIFFRATSITHAFDYLRKLFVVDFFQPFNFLTGNFEQLRLLHVTFACLGMIIIEWHGRKSLFALSKSNLSSQKYWRYFVYVVLIMVTLFLKGSHEEFIYFAF